ncbi:bifunctional metallophosphatase/5'-nucleotidase [Sediminibacillus halophilus]|uniref:2',3'-cyclic-nucleotide 2'-phosphodiesterase/5'-or 3'-nucleotidase, 5'-nucleotidase family n=1 Tax=Sediminibacillus halophilus TaxID=482461 RepID=A0A1G9P0R6_9BACI|nr:5'-nucleotidase C-terminal domain-containing protein [Sediminibacillus halophilus]SDL92229.1 2',3'-cyclic-nucleotide 2'-phosphodiesterase/5'-or 3'-nucleotidase, 5'-nucleotidase family [Sediminibacillus halophilus]
MKLKIIHTNDVHSHYDNFSRAVSLIRQHKDKHTLLLDGGDFADFKSIELQGTKGMAAIELLSEAGYDALTIGNNEIFNGMETLEYMAGNSTVPFISNNLLKKDLAPIEGVVSSTIIEKDGLRILITGSSPNLDEFNDGLGIHVSDYKTALQTELERKRGLFDLCVVLSHIGTAADQKLAEEIEGIDVLISAHDHQLYTEPRVINGTICNSAGSFGEHVGVLELTVENGKVTLTDSSMLSTDKAEASSRIADILATNKEKGVKNLSQPLYTLKQPLWHDVVEENPLANLIADGLKDLLQTDIGLINSGIAHTGIFEYVSEKKLIETCPSPLNPTTFEIKGKTLKVALEQSLDAQVCLADGRGPGFRGKYAGRLHISGATVLHDGYRLIKVSITGREIEDETWYTVASSDYLQRGSGYPVLADNRNPVFKPEYIRNVIREYAAKPTFLKQTTNGRWIKGADILV